MSAPKAIDHAALREHFFLPTNSSVDATSVPEDRKDEPCAYLCGNSLGALPKRSEELIQQEIRVWASKAVEGHFHHPHGRKWVSMTDHVNPLLAELVGAKVNEVACMSTLTANLHLMMSTFYKPTATRYKIFCEAKAFPSDQYAFASQAAFHGYDPKTAIIELAPRAGEFTLRDEDILDVINSQGSEIALVIFSGVQYYTGQVFPMEKITRAAKAQGCICGWDLAHAIGNVPLAIHDWGADFAVWCTYKYLNSGPGGIGGLYIHEQWEDKETPKLAGWWGHTLDSRFEMPPDFRPTRGAQGYQQSNPSVICIASLLGSLQVFKQAGMMANVRPRALKLSMYLESLLVSSKHYVPAGEVAKRYPASMAAHADADGAGGADRRNAADVNEKLGFTILTPLEPESRGTQLSLLFLPASAGVMSVVFNSLVKHGVIGDMRQPGVIRLAPVALYNNEGDCERAARSLENILDGLGGM